MTMALIVMAASTALQAYGQYQEGKEVDEQSKIAAGWHRYNADIATQEAEAEREATSFALKQQRREGDSFQSTTRNIIGASGVDIQGSPLLVMEDNAEQLKLRREQTLKKGVRRASAFESQSILDEGKTVATRKMGKAARRAGKTAAFGSLLQGAAQTYFAGSK